MIESVATVAEAATGSGDDLTLCLQALHPRVDETFAKLIEIEETEQQRDETAEVENHDAARQR